MQPGRGSKLKNHKAEPVKGASVLKSAAIFGPNAGGKSNFIKALQIAKYLVLHGTSADEPIEYHPFRLSSRSKNEDTTIIFHILCNNKKYEYGFSYNADRISKEWLNHITPKTVHCLFSRDVEKPFDLSYLLKLNPKEEEKQFLQFFAKSTPTKQLFIHEIYSRNVHDNVSDISDLEAIFSWFLDSLKIILPETPYNQGVLLKAADDEDLKKVFRVLLKYFATGIEDIHLTDVELDKLGLSQNILNNIKTDMSKSKNNEVYGTLKLNHDLFLIKIINGVMDTKMLMTVHRQIDTGKSEYFSLREESDGTNRLFDYIPLILDFIHGGKVFVVDEIERSLHPTLIRKILDLFYRYSKENPSQLIFTTHESFLMTQNLLRSDEIWLMEKSIDGISSCDSIDKKFNPRFDKKLRQSYFEGDYGAIPKLASEEDFDSFYKNVKDKKI
jgi:AAA15 family ATPase/GTPase